MSTSTYITGRQKYARPQAMLWSNNPGTLVLSPKANPTDPDKYMYVPDGYESGSSGLVVTDPELANEFIILSDHNRSPIDFKINRLESRERMINGRMRSYHIADKLNISLSWNLLPSRSYGLFPAFDSTGTPTGVGDEYTVDGGAGGAEMLDWYNNHEGPFWVYLAYDNYMLFGTDAAAHAHLSQYNQVVQMYISDFAYSVQKRGATNFDMWNIQVTLEEV